MNPTLRFCCIIIGSGLMTATAFVVFSLMGAVFTVTDAVAFALLGGLAFAVGAMRRENDV